VASFIKTLFPAVIQPDSNISMLKEQLNGTKLHFDRTFRNLPAIFNRSINSQIRF